MPGKDIVVVGASAGGIDAIRTVLAGLPAGYTGSIFVVVHTGPDAPGVLDVIFGRAGPLPAGLAVSGERILPGRVYVANPDHHLIIEPGKMRLTRGPKENRFRPAIDPLFRSAAQTYGPRVVGVILSGGLDDGTSGLWTVKQLGGTAIVQDPQEAVAPSMPQSAMNHVRVDHVLRLDEIAPMLAQLAVKPADAPEGGFPVPDEVNIEVNIAKEDKAKDAGVFRLGEASNFACPECHGVLLQLKDAIPPRYRCHTGHAYTLDSLLSEMDAKIEDSLWNAIRALEERVMLMREAAEHMRDVHGNGEELMKRAEETQERRPGAQGRGERGRGEGERRTVACGHSPSAWRFSGTHRCAAASRRPRGGRRRRPRCSVEKGRRRRVLHGDRRSAHAPRRRAARLGVRAVLLKPFEIEELHRGADVLRRRRRDVILSAAKDRCGRAA